MRRAYAASWVHRRIFVEAVEGRSSSRRELAGGVDAPSGAPCLGCSSGDPAALHDRPEGGIVADEVVGGVVAHEVADQISPPLLEGVHGVPA